MMSTQWLYKINTLSVEDILTLAALLTAISVIFVTVRTVVQRVYKVIRMLQDAAEILEDLRELSTHMSVDDLQETLTNTNERIQVLEQKQQYMFDVLLQTCIFEATVDGKCRYVSLRWSDLTGLSLAEAKGTGWLSAIHPDDKERVKSEWNLAVTDGRAFDTVTRYHNAKTGEVVKVRLRAMPVSGLVDNILGYFGICQPVVVDTYGAKSITNQNS